MSEDIEVSAGVETPRPDAMVVRAIMTASALDLLRVSTAMMRTIMESVGYAGAIEPPAQSRFRKELTSRERDEAASVVDVMRRRMSEALEQGLVGEAEGAG